MSAGSVGQFIWGQAAPVATPAPVPGVAPVTIDPAAPVDSLTGSGGMVIEAGLRDWMTQRDLGDGKYEILGSGGESYGVGYKDVRSAIRDYGITNADRQTVQGEDGQYTNKFLMAPVRDSWQDANGVEYNPDELAKWQNNQQVKLMQSSQEWGSGYGQYTPSIYDDQDMSGFAQVPVQLNEMGQPEYGNGATVKSGLLNHQVIDPLKYKTKEEAKAALYGVIGPDYFGGVMGDWEALGQVIQGHDIPAPNNWGELPTNGLYEGVSGENTLYGSKPVFGKDEKGAYTLLGYQMDVSPNEASNFNNGADSIVNTEDGTYATHNGKSHNWNNATWRELVDADGWKKNATIGKDGKIFVDKNNVAHLPGWINKESYAHKDTYTGMNPVVETVLNVVGYFFAYGVPIGSLLSGANDLNEGQGKAAGQSFTRAAISYAMSGGGYESGGTSSLGNGISQGGGEGIKQGAGQGIQGGLGQGISTGTTANAAAAAAATEAGLSATTQTVNAIKEAATKFNSLTLSDFGMTTGSKAIDTAIASSVKSALKTAVQNGVTGKDLDDTAKAAITSALASLIGSGAAIGAKEVTGSNLAASAAGTAASMGTGMLAKNAMAPDAPSGNTQSSGGGYTAPAATPSAQTSTRTQYPASYAGSVGRFIWR